MKSLGIIAASLLLFSGVRAFSYDFQKCSPTVEYWYNYYYDPGALKRNCSDSAQEKPIKKIDTTANEIQQMEGSSGTSEDSIEHEQGNRSKLMDDLPTEPDDIEANPYEPLVIDSCDLSFREGNPYVKVFIDYTGDLSDLQSLGVIIEIQVEGGIYARIPLNMLPQVDSLETVKRITIQSKLETQGIEEGELDISIPEIFVDSVRILFNNKYTGKDVVVGIIDTGIDYWDMDFRNSDGTTRIKFLWDQTSYQGIPPSEPEFLQDGSEWSKPQIDSSLSSIGPYITSNDESGHGTHVAGTCCGNGQETGNGYPSGRYIGVAPECDIVFVKTDFTIPGIRRGILYIARRADSLCEPWVINMSLGIKHYGARNGTSFLDQFLDSIVTDINNFDTSLYGYGRAIVVAAGNEGTEISNPNHNPLDKFHASSVGSATVEFDVNCSSDTVLPDYGIDRVDFYILYSDEDEYEITVRAPYTGDPSPNIYDVYGPYGIGEHTGHIPDSVTGESWPWDIVNDGVIFITNDFWDTGFPDPLSQGGTPNDHVIGIRLSEVLRGNFFRHLKPGIWEFEMSHISGPGKRWDIYRYDYYPKDKDYKYFTNSSYDRQYTILEPSTSSSAIAVGSYNTKDSWSSLSGPMSLSGFTYRDTSYFSSLGPSRDNRNKPELFAPGAWIMSSRSDQISDPDSYGHISHPLLIDADSKHYVSIGTSMAAPHVAGTIALMLDRNPTLSQDTISQILQTSSNKGYLNAYKAILNTKSYAIEEGEYPTILPSGFIVFQNYPNPFNPTTEIKFSIPDNTNMKSRNVSIDIYNILGEKVKSIKWANVSSGIHSIVWDGTNDCGNKVASGVYLYKSQCGDEAVVKKMILLR